MFNDVKRFRKIWRAKSSGSIKSSVVGKLHLRANLLPQREFKRNFIIDLRGGLNAILSRSSWIPSFSNTRRHMPFLFGVWRYLGGNPEASCLNLRNVLTYPLNKSSDVWGKVQTFNNFDNRIPLATACESSTRSKTPEMYSSSSQCWQLSWSCAPAQVRHRANNSFPCGDLNGIIGV